MVGWQFFVATGTSALMTFFNLVKSSLHCIGIFAGHVASYITRNSWRSQILTAAIPAFALLLMTCAACESPRWRILQGQ